MFLVFVFVVVLGRVTQCQAGTGVFALTSHFLGKEVGKAKVGRSTKAGREGTHGKATCGGGLPVLKNH